MNHLGTKEIKTQRLTLRKFNENDAVMAYRNWTSDEKVIKFLTWPVHQSVDVTKKVLNDWIESYQDLSFYQWAIVLDEINEPIGSISVVDINEQTNMVHIGYCIGSQWWHQGITSEAFAAVIQYLFEEVKVNRIETQHEPNNTNSGKVMKKCGLTYEGTLRQAMHSNQGIVDACVYGILASEYFQKKQ